MKRINSEEIEKKLENYLKKRNFSTAGSYFKMNEKSIDLKTMAFNDIASMESTIYDYYVYSSIYSLSSSDYFNQYCV
jgi:hypothetical protein